MVRVITPTKYLQLHRFGVIAMYSYVITLREDGFPSRYIRVRSQRARSLDDARAEGLLHINRLVTVGNLTATDVYSLVVSRHGLPCSTVLYPVNQL